MTAGERHRGYTLIELLVVLAVLAVLASLSAPLFLDRVDDARETVLRHNLHGLRRAIDEFQRDHARYPASLAELVERRYLRALPQDPIAGRADAWVVVPALTGSGVFDIHSAAPGRALDGSAYADW